MNHLPVYISLLVRTESRTESGEGGGGGGAGGGPASWRLTLDQDLIETLKTSFPSWFPADAQGSCSRDNHDHHVDSGSRDVGSCGESSPVRAESPRDIFDLLLATSPIAERSNSSSSGVSSNESNGGGTPELSFRSSSISSTNSYPPSPPSLVIYATQIEQPKPRRQKCLGDNMADNKGASFRQPAAGSRSEPPQLHIVDSFSFDAANNTRQTSPPKAIVDSSPLQLAMDKNKECKYIGDCRWILDCLLLVLAYLTKLANSI